MGRKFTIALYPNNTALEDGNLTCDLGQIRHARQRISLNAILPTDGLDATLLHELVHLTSRYSAAKMEEDDVQRFTEVLYAFLRGFGLWCEFPWPDKDEKCPGIPT
jgi:hypothetical protein